MKDIADEHIQLTVLESKHLTVISLYRSITDKHLATYLKDAIPATGNCLIIGDFNLCTKKFPNHDVFLFL